jgi:hypothetical protein
MKLLGGVLVGAAGENVGDLIMGGQKPLHLPRRLEPLHNPLWSPRRLVDDPFTTLCRSRPASPK